MNKGSCLCGAVHYEIEGELGPISICHCSRCRKVNGSAFLAAALIEKDRFHITQGEDVLKAYESSPGVHRVFCGNCGSPICSRRDAGHLSNFIRLRIGTLDTPVEGKPAMHIFVSEKAEWFDIPGDAPQYAERPE